MRMRVQCYIKSFGTEKNGIHVYWWAPKSTYGCAFKKHTEKEKRENMRQQCEDILENETFSSIENIFYFFLPLFSIRSLTHPLGSTSVNKPKRINVLYYTKLANFIHTQIDNSSAMMWLCSTQGLSFLQNWNSSTAHEWIVEDKVFSCLYSHISIFLIELCIKQIKFYTKAPKHNILPLCSSFHLCTFCSIVIPTSQMFAFLWMDDGQMLSTWKLKWDKRLCEGHYF